MEYLVERLKSNHFVRGSYRSFKLRARRTARKYLTESDSGYISCKCDFRRFSAPRTHVFFGYYDVSPFSADDQYLLAMHLPVPSQRDLDPGPIALGYYDLTEENPAFVELGLSNTWSWQLGARLQWVDANQERQVLYNCLVNGRFGCVLQDFESGDVVKEFEQPMYSVSCDGRWGLSLDFSRLHRLREGYGYPGVPDLTCGEQRPKKQGVWLTNLETKTQQLLFSVAQIAELHSVASMKGAEHYFNHLLFAPSGNRFLVYHLWVKDGRRYSRIVTANRDGTDIYILTDYGHASHYVWLSDDELLAYTTHQDEKTCLRVYKDQSLESRTVFENEIQRDGHPWFCESRGIIVIDTYPDSYGDQKLKMLSFDQGKEIEIGAFFSPLGYRGPSRCDLHPRMNETGTMLCVDSAASGDRAMYVLNLQSLLEL